MTQTTAQTKIMISQFAPSGDYYCSLFDTSKGLTTCLTTGCEGTKEDAELWQRTTQELQKISKHLWAPDRSTRQALAITE